MRTYVALIEHGPNWLTGKSVYEQGAPVEQHLVAMRDRYDEGVLVLGGPFDHGGGIAVLDVPDEESARAVMDADPAVKAGVMVYRIRALRGCSTPEAGCVPAATSPVSASPASMPYVTTETGVATFVIVLGLAGFLLERRAGDFERPFTAATGQRRDTASDRLLARTH